MRNVLLHAALPFLAPLALVALYFTPRATFGCTNRGLMALAVVFVAALGSAYAAVQSRSSRRGGSRRQQLWWTLTTLLLMLPAALLLGPLR